MKDPVTGKGDPLKQGAVFFSCNDTQSEHWFLRVICPRKMCIVVLDSLPRELVKTTVLKRVKRMVLFLLEVEGSVDINHGSLYSNRPGEIPQQDNKYDCGIYTCVYARCMAAMCLIVAKTEVPTKRQLMIQELHQKRVAMTNSTTN